MNVGNNLFVCATTGNKPDHFLCKGSLRHHMLNQDSFTTGPGMMRINAAFGIWACLQAIDMAKVGIFHALTKYVEYALYRMDCTAVVSKPSLDSLIPGVYK